MAGQVRPIRFVGDPVLHRPCVPVERFDDELARLVDDMFASMYAADGVGLAANQVGVGLRVFVYDCPDAEGLNQVGVVVNPTLQELRPEDRRLDESDEGCLSVPDHRGGHRDDGPLPAARDRPPRGPPLHRPAQRPAAQGRAAGVRGIPRRECSCRRRSSAGPSVGGRSAGSHDRVDLELVHCDTPKSPERARDQLRGRPVRRSSRPALMRSMLIARSRRW
jgi:hypothetical protein